MKLTIVVAVIALALLAATRQAPLQRVREAF